MAEPGDLISFHFKSSNKLQNNKSTIGVTVDAENLDIKVGKNTSIRVDNVEDGTISEESVNSYATNYKEWVEAGSDPETKPTMSIDQPTVFFNNATPDYMDTGDLNIKAAIDETRFQHVYPGYSTPINIESSPEIAEALEERLSQEATNKEMDKYQAEVKLYGNPQIVRDRVITIKGIAKTYCGNYYITDASHVINKNGYVTSLDVVKVPISLVKAKTHYKYSTKDGELVGEKLVVNNYHGYNRDTYIQAWFGYLGKEAQNRVRKLSSEVIPNPSPEKSEDTSLNPWCYIIKPVHTILKYVLGSVGLVMDPHDWDEN
jgi:hypothetical protein